LQDDPFVSGLGIFFTEPIGFSFLKLHQPYVPGSARSLYWGWVYPTLKIGNPYLGYINPTGLMTISNLFRWFKKSGKLTSSYGKYHHYLQGFKDFQTVGGWPWDF